MLGSWCHSRTVFLDCRHRIRHSGDRGSAELLLYHSFGLGNILSVLLLHLGSAVVVLQQHLEHRWRMSHVNMSSLQKCIDPEQQSRDSCCFPQIPAWNSKDETIPLTKVTLRTQHRPWSSFGSTFYLLYLLSYSNIPFYHRANIFGMLLWNVLWTF